MVSCVVVVGQESREMTERDLHPEVWHVSKVGLMHVIPAQGLEP